jgi:hypothetical protein
MTATWYERMLAFSELEVAHLSFDAAQVALVTTGEDMAGGDLS